MSESKIAPHLFVVFGGTGDLMERKLLPALRHLWRQLDESHPFHILGVARDQEMSDSQFRSWAEEALAGEEGDVGKWCSEILHYQPIGKQKEADYRALRQRIEEIEQAHDLPQNRVLYLALPPSAMEPTIESLGQTGLSESRGWTRLVIEKPFGRDLESARELNQVLHRHFSEKQVYRIDHYLGKETVQNLLVFRFANPIFESLWNRDRVESVHITVAEDIGVGSRAGYYDRSGALRDMVQNHLTQLLCLTAMEVPATFEADSIRDEKVKVLRSTPSPDSKSVVFGRYGEGVVGGEKVAAYLDEEDVPEDSSTETFVSLKLEISNWRWQGVPFFLRTGKRLKRRLTQIRVRFRCPPVSLFQPFTECRLSSNELVITLQPDEGFRLRFEVKTPGEDVDMETEELRFRYADTFGALPEAYETLLIDIVTGDQTLFVRGDEAEEAWKLYKPILSEDHEIHEYEAGSWGPEEAGYFPDES